MNICTFVVGSDKPKDATPVGRSGRNDDKILTYDQIVKKCLRSRKLWEDSQFPANHGSLYLDGRGDYDVEWKRPHVRFFCFKMQHSLVNSNQLFGVCSGIQGEGSCGIVKKTEDFCKKEKIW